MGITWLPMWPNPKRTATWCLFDKAGIVRPKAGLNAIHGKPCGFPRVVIETAFRSVQVWVEGERKFGI